MPNTKIHMGRRQWIGLTLVGSTAIVGTVVAPPLLKEEPDRIIKAILKKRLAPAQIPDKTYQAFLTMFKGTEHYTGLIKAYKIFSSLSPVYQTGALHKMPLFKDKIIQIEELVITHFSLSTNFFYNPKVISGEEPVEFISYWRLRACNNPFATFDSV